VSDLFYEREFTHGSTPRRISWLRTSKTPAKEHGR
jgi:hypothetical protein